MVLQRYALRFTISDATLDSLKLPRSTPKAKQEPNHVDKEHETTSPVNDSESSEPVHKPQPAVLTEQTPTKPEEMETVTPALQQNSSIPTPGSPLNPITNSENMPPQSLQLNQLQPKMTAPPATHPKPLIKGDAKPLNKHTLPQVAQVQPDTTRSLHTLPSPSSVAPRPVPLLAAKPYCQPRNAQSGHKSVKVSPPYQRTKQVCIT